MIVEPLGVTDGTVASVLDPFTMVSSFGSNLRFQNGSKTELSLPKDIVYANVIRTLKWVSRIRVRDFFSCL